MKTTTGANEDNRGRLKTTAGHTTGTNQAQIRTTRAETKTTRNATAFPTGALYQTASFKTDLEISICVAGGLCFFIIEKMFVQKSARLTSYY